MTCKNHPPSLLIPIHSAVGAFLKRHRHNRGFTLIELSIVLVVIGLIVGGVLTGQSLISAAQVRAQITQIEKYNSAVNDFYSKYGGLPGDLNMTAATQFGLNITNCDGTQSRRDGNGLLQSSAVGAHYSREDVETILFWQDLSTTGLIDGTFPNGGAAGGCALDPSFSLTPGPTYVGDYFPVAKVGNGQFLYVYSVNSLNWYGLSAATGTDTSDYLISYPTLPVKQSYAIDSKIDDGLPTTGNVQAVYIGGCCTIVPANAYGSDNASSCYNTTSNTYSITYNNGNGANCALSFKFQ